MDSSISPFEQECDFRAELVEHECDLEAGPVKPECDFEADFEATIKHLRRPFVVNHGKDDRYYVMQEHADLCEYRVVK